MDFARLWADHYGPLYFWLFGLTHRKDLAEDLVSSAFAKAWEHQGSLRDPAKAKAWLFQIAYNEWCLHRRLRRPESLDDPRTDYGERVQEPRSFIDELEARGAYERLIKLLRELRPRHRAAVRRYLSGEPCQGTWGSRLNKARQELARRGYGNLSKVR